MSNHDWAELHGYTGYACPVCGWSGVTDSNACERCDGGEQPEKEDADDLEDAYEVGLAVGSPDPRWSEAQRRDYREGIRHARLERLEAEGKRGQR